MQASYRAMDPSDGRIRWTRDNVTVEWLRANELDNYNYGAFLCVPIPTRDRRLAFSIVVVRARYRDVIACR